MLALLVGAIPVRAAASSRVLAQAPAPPEDYVFPAGTALLLFYVSPDHAADFEAVAARISQVLASSTDPVRRQQAASWRMFRSAEPVRGAIVYVFLLDPVVAGSDYDPVRVLTEGLPAEAQALYQKLKASVIRVERLGLTKLP